MQYSITKEINSLSFLKTLGNKFDLFLVGELEVEPFTKWSTEFAAEYWFIKHSLLENKEVELDFSAIEVDNLCTEMNLNIIWLTLTDKKNFELKCVDGSWKVEILNPIFENLEEVISFGE